ncbi:hypothetical protein SAMN05428961_110128 [Paenibacillus sp. OK060]|uniref:hypothetical protein n=1 Tax=Paenibacillus sp. OK060 TaxID=1881034 RepID=UPI0008841210|nr:hypothetical protein [Paenibacillus sp. OK060]SDM16474.1 hypothetical protein SAMN05428961_110128 [Paenibacillus sp. OK060]
MLTPTAKANILHMGAWDQVTVGGYVIGENIRFEVNSTDTKFTVKMYDRMVLLEEESFQSADEVIRYIEKKL